MTACKNMAEYPAGLLQNFVYLICIKNIKATKYSKTNAVEYFGLPSPLLFTVFRAIFNVALPAVCKRVFQPTGFALMRAGSGQHRILTHTVDNVAQTLHFAIN